MFVVVVVVVVEVREAAFIAYFYLDEIIGEDDERV